MMKRFLIFILFLSCTCAFSQSEKLGYHDIKTDAGGKIIPWYSPDIGKAYSHVIKIVWNFWDTMRIDLNGLPYYMNHQVWQPNYNDTRGIAGSQFEMALNSWSLLYRFSGDERLKENMKFIADYYLSHSLSPSDALWPNLPFPYNTLCYAGVYDGDMVIGRGYTQPDKAGSFGNELIKLYKLVGNESHGQTPTGIYLKSAIEIANTLSKHIVPGDENSSPLPFKVHAFQGKDGKIKDLDGRIKNVELFNYTSNWTGTMELFLSLIKMKKGNTVAYQQSFNTLLKWMIKYPIKNNKWGPFFEDISGYSETQINAISFAQFMMNHPEYFPDWKIQVKQIFEWVYKKMGNAGWNKYGVIVVNEQTAYQVPGNSHSARQSAAELQFAALTGDSSYTENSIRRLSWATYMVDHDGKNCYPQDEIWMSDGYGDYVRHYLNAFAYAPNIAPSQEDHILSSTSIIQYVEYKNGAYKRNLWKNSDTAQLKLRYSTYDSIGREVIRISQKPSRILFNNKEAFISNEQNPEGFQWQPLDTGGFLIISRKNVNEVVILE